MGSNVEIRRANFEDAEAISQVIVSTLRASNAKGYAPKTILRAESNFTPAAIRELFDKRSVFVAVAANKLVGTGSLDKCIVRCVYVISDYQGSGIGKQLMTVVEFEARSQNIDQLTIPSSVTAETFFAKLGYSVVEERFCDSERTIVMTKCLSAEPKSHS
ncbi:MAG: GNAT family N-acetyltransferase [Proteobacteria bacterium]|nr:GNAT family N-acetyltransferase [Pseudomonadota bacterium]